MVTIVVLMPAAATAQATSVSPLQGAELLAALRAGGYVLYFRHTDTDWNQRDERPIRYEDCSTQRNLSSKGRDSARAIGTAIRSLGIPIGTVLAAPMCRTFETATLAFGAAEKSAAVRESGPAPPGTAERYAALRALLATSPSAGTHTVLVGHAYPFFSLVGGQYLDEGQAAVARPGSTTFEVVARIHVGEWATLDRGGRP